MVETKKESIRGKVAKALIVIALAIVVWGFFSSVFSQQEEQKNIGEDKNTNHTNTYAQSMQGTSTPMVIPTNDMTKKIATVFLQAQHCGTENNLVWYRAWIENGSGSVKINFNATPGKYTNKSFFLEPKKPYSFQIETAGSPQKVIVNERVFLDNVFMWEKTINLTCESSGSGRSSSVPSVPIIAPTRQPTAIPTTEPTTVPTVEPTTVPTKEPTPVPTPKYTMRQTEKPTAAPTPKHTDCPPAGKSTTGPAECSEIPEYPGIIFPLALISTMLLIAYMKKGRKK